MLRTGLTPRESAGWLRGEYEAYGCYPSTAERIIPRRRLSSSVVMVWVKKLIMSASSAMIRERPLIRCRQP
jgi:hypothetical protein